MEIFRISSPDSEQIDLVADMLRRGELCVIPTETVYGLAANALDSDAVDGIFRAKNRPNDNPLTIHISDVGDVDRYAKNVPENARVLAEKFWSGALTMVLERADSVPSKISAGSPTVALRMPDNDISRAIIRKSGVPIVATSANRSGSPSPTTLAHVLDDMSGRVSAVVDGGELELGIESTVINMLCTPPKILRLGSIGVAELEEAIGPVEFDESVAPASAHKHYSIGKNAVLVSGSLDKFINYVHSVENYAVLCFEGEEKFFSRPCVSLGDPNNPIALGKRLFSALRELEKLEVSTVFIRCPDGHDSVSLAVKSRLLKTAENKFVEL
ncbi:MAG: threonylcarbamoyl-AMP synthase [Clostridia bacterium]|nr:threonylcarbamoyl-AMP synthase [Clostridia bacterium]